MIFFESSSDLHVHIEVSAIWSQGSFIYQRWFDTIDNEIYEADVLPGVWK